MKKKSKRKRKKRISLAKLLRHFKPRVYPINSRPYVPFIDPMPGENPPPPPPWPQPKMNPETN